MDEGFFLYFEDVDFCLAARRAGWRISFDPTLRAVHHRGGSAPVKALAARRKRLPAYYYASRTRLMRKLGARSDVELTHLSLRHGLISTSDGRVS